MSLLHHKPQVYFDAYNDAHREVFHNFRKNQSWKGHQPFVLEPKYVNIPEMIADKLLDYYTSREFEELEVEA